VSVASFVAAQRTEHGVPHALTCRALDLSESWFYKWRNRGPTPRQQRRAALDVAVKRCFDASGGTYGSPRVLADCSPTGGGCRRRASRRRWPVRVWGLDQRSDGAAH
jgi:putative transposase